MSRNRKAARLDSRQATDWKMFSPSGHIPASCRNHRGFRSVGASLARKHLDVLNGGHYTPSALQFPPQTWVVATLGLKTKNAFHP